MRILSGNLFSEIPSDVPQLSNLTSLFLGWNRINRLHHSIGDMVFISSLADWTTLLLTTRRSFTQKVKINILHLTGNKLNELPAEIGNLKCVVVLVEMKYSNVL